MDTITTKMTNDRDASFGVEDENGKFPRLTSEEAKGDMLAAQEVEELRRELEAPRTQNKSLQEENNQLHEGMNTARLNQPALTPDGTLPLTKKIDDSKTGFSNLSGELRNVIYKLTLVDKATINLSSPKRGITAYKDSSPTIKINSLATGLLHVNQ